MTYEETLSIDARYQRAETLLQGLGTNKLVQNDRLFPYWIEGTSCFWYERSTASQSKEYRLVDASAASNKPAFDHQDLATALSQVSEQAIDKDNIPMASIVMTLSPLTVSFDAFDQRWQFSALTGDCHSVMPLAKTDEALSPDGKTTAFVRDFNLWLRDNTSREEWPVTSEGVDGYAYGGPNAAWGWDNMIEVPAIWSSDSKRLLTVLRDRREVLTSPVVNHAPDDDLKPAVHRYTVAYPGDEAVESYQFVSIDITSADSCLADYPSIPCAPSSNLGLFFSRLVWWGNNHRLAYFIAQNRGDRSVELVEFDTHTGATKVLFQETSASHINIVTSDNLTAPSHRYLPATNELIWWSERSGWGHLYLYDLNTGALKHPITLNTTKAAALNEWLVRDVLYVDEQKREIIIQTAGRAPGDTALKATARNPYYRDICRVNLDTGEITTVFCSDEDVMVHFPESYQVLMDSLQRRSGSEVQGISPNGEYIVATRSRVDQAPVTELLNRNGEHVMTLEVTDTTSLPTHWTWPEPVQVLAADNITSLQGVLFRPSQFDPEKSYPLINYIGSGPWMSMIPVGSFNSTRDGYIDWHYFNAAALAELGFMVLQLDSRGTPLRSKAFQDYSYGWVPGAIDAEDHVAALKQLIKRYPSIDQERIGSYCAGYPSGLTHFLENQDLYKVHVQGNVLDVRLLSCSMKGDIWESVEGPGVDKHYPEHLVTNLQGKLLMMHPLFGPQASSYPLSSAFRVVQALQKANKNFELLMTSNKGASFGHYSTRRIWDYFVKHLMNAKPPKEFALNASILP